MTRYPDAPIDLAEWEKLARSYSGVLDSITMPCGTILAFVAAVRALRTIRGLMASPDDMLTGVGLLTICDVALTGIIDTADSAPRAGREE